MALLLSAALLPLLLASCSSSRSTQPSSSAGDADAPSGPHFTLVYQTTDGTLARHTTHDESVSTLAAGVQSIGASAPSPDGNTLAISYATADSTHLALLDRSSRSLRPVHAHAGPATYSLAWHPADGRLAFAYYTPAREGTRGPGDVLIARPDGSTDRVGCSAAREVLHWQPDGSLAARDDENMYLVAATDCATLASFDARRIHHATYSADGSLLAYIYRELEYDRAAGAYRPDSTLMLSAANGSNDDVIFGDERQARHLRWAPEAVELAFTARVEDADRRQVMIYNAAQDRVLFLIPPTQASTGDQAHPRWSPSGSYIAFTLRSGTTSTAAVQVEGQTRRLGPTQGPVAGWMDDRTLMVRGPEQLRVTRLTGDTQYTTAAPATFIHGWLAAPTSEATTDADG